MSMSSSSFYCSVYCSFYCHDVVREGSHSHSAHRVLLNEFGVVRPYRTFSNYISSGDTRCARCNMHRFGEVQAHRTSSNLLNNFCATTNNDANKVCIYKKNKNRHSWSFSFMSEFLFEIEPHGPPSSVCFCTIRGVGPSQICLGENQKNNK